MLPPSETAPVSSSPDAVPRHAANRFAPYRSVVRNGRKKLAGQNDAAAALKVSDRQTRICTTPSDQDDGDFGNAALRLPPALRSERLPYRAKVAAKERFFFQSFLTVAISYNTGIRRPGALMDDGALQNVMNSQSRHVTRDAPQLLRNIAVGSLRLGLQDVGGFERTRPRSISRVTSTRNRGNANAPARI